MWFLAPWRSLVFIGVLADTSCIVLAQVPSTAPPDTTARSLAIAVDPDGQKAWAMHGLTSEQRKNLHEPFDWAIENRFIPGGVLLVIHRGDVIFREGFGVADIETKRPFSVDAPCRIASVTKPHTATLIAMLVDQGKLAWDDPVDQYLPSLAKLKIGDNGFAKRPPKIRELLSHTAGFPGNDERRAGPPSFKIDGSLEEAVDDLAKNGLASEPGTAYVYTGLGYMVAGRVAEVVTGQEFGSLMNERLLKPIGATTATFHNTASEELKSQMPTMYQRENGQLIKIDLAEKSESSAAFPTPGGGLISTLDDVGKMMMLHRNRGNVSGKSLIAKETLQALYRPQPATGRNGYGLGFNVMRTNATGQGVRVRHTGASGTFALLDFQSDLVVVMLSQVPSKQTQPFSNRLMKAVEAVFASR